MFTIFLVLIKPHKKQLLGSVQKYIKHSQFAIPKIEFSLFLPFVNFGHFVQFSVSFLFIKDGESVHFLRVQVSPNIDLFNKQFLKRMDFFFAIDLIKFKGSMDIIVCQSNIEISNYQNLLSLFFEFFDLDLELF